MTKGMRMMVHILASPWMQVGRGIVTVISCLIILGVLNMSKIDAITYAIPEEYLPYMLIAAILAVLLIGYIVRSKLHADAADNKVANGTIENTNSLPYDKRYDVLTLIASILAAGVGMYAAPALVDQLFINAGAGIFAGMTFIAAGVLVAIFIPLLHCGARVTIIQAAKYAVDVTEAVKEAAGDIQQAIDNVNEVKKK